MSLSGGWEEAEGVCKSLHPRIQRVCFRIAYGEEEDRFNSDAGGIPDDIDVVITHGPPKFSEYEVYDLDANEKGEHLGCEKLARGMRSVKPRLHCFGHIPEGRGAMTIDWKDGGMSRAESLGSEKSSVLTIRDGIKEKETLFVNAAMDGSGKGMLVDVYL